MGEADDPIMSRDGARGFDRWEGTLTNASAKWSNGRSDQAQWERLAANQIDGCLALI